MLNLKKAEESVLNLKKEYNIESQQAEIALADDGSGSMDQLYRRGSYKGEPQKSAMQRLHDRVLPIGMGFSTSKEVNVWSFGSNVQRISTPLTEDNLNGYVDKYLGANMGGTNYAPVINDIARWYRDKYNYTKETRTIALGNAPVRRSWITRFFDWLRGYTPPVNKIVEKTFTIDVADEPADGPLLVLFCTDGINDDQYQTIRALQDCAGLPIFWQFIMITENGGDPANLEELDEMDGRYIDNANLMKVSLDELNTISDDEVNRRFMKEFVNIYLPLAKSDKYRLIKA